MQESLVVQPIAKKDFNEKKIYSLNSQYDSLFDNVEYEPLGKYPNDRFSGNAKYLGQVKYKILEYDFKYNSKLYGETFFSKNNITMAIYKFDNVEEAEKALPIILYYSESSAWFHLYLPSWLKLTLNYNYKQFYNGKDNSFSKFLMKPTNTNVFLSSTIIKKYDSIDGQPILYGLFGNGNATSSLFFDENYVVYMEEHSQNNETYLSDLAQKVTDGAIHLNNHDEKIIELKSVDFSE